MLRSHRPLLQQLPYRPPSQPTQMRKTNVLRIISQPSVQWSELQGHEKLNQDPQSEFQLVQKEKPENKILFS